MPVAVSTYYIYDDALVWLMKTIDFGHGLLYSYLRRYQVQDQAVEQVRQAFRRYPGIRSSMAGSIFF